MTETLKTTSLLVRPWVELTPSIVPVILQLDAWFDAVQLTCWVTSGKRDTAVQLGIIRQAAIDRGLANEFPFVRGMKLEDRTAFQGSVVPTWLPIWGQLLTIGFLVNPPESARVPFDYVHPKSHRRIVAGTLIQPSAHLRGMAFDIGGKGGMIDTVVDEEAVVNRAFSSGEIPSLLSYTVEHENNAVHCDCKEVV